MLASIRPSVRNLWIKLVTRAGRSHHRRQFFVRNLELDADVAGFAFAEFSRKFQQRFTEPSLAVDGYQIGVAVGQRYAQRGTLQILQAESPRLRAPEVWPRIFLSTRNLRSRSLSPDGSRRLTDIIHRIDLRSREQPACIRDLREKA